MSPRTGLSGLYGRARLQRFRSYGAGFSGEGSGGKYRVTKCTRRKGDRCRNRNLSPRASDNSGRGKSGSALKREEVLRMSARHRFHDEQGKASKSKHSMSLCIRACISGPSVSRCSRQTFLREPLAKATRTLRPGNVKSIGGRRCAPIPLRFGQTRHLRRVSTSGNNSAIARCSWFRLPTRQWCRPL